MPIDEEQDDLAESIKILATDDERLKSFGQLFANDSARKILQLLFNEEMTAARISQRTDISLQLVKYHLQKLQELGVVQISKTSKNSKSHDMKHYTAKSFSVVVVPPKLSEKTKSSRLLIHSFRHIYKVAGLGVATGISGMFSALQLQQGSRLTQDFASTVSPVPDVEQEGIAGEGGGGEDTLQATQPATQQQDASQKEPRQQDMPPEESMPQDDAPQVQDQSMAKMEDAPQEQAITAGTSETDSMAADDPAAVEMESADLDSDPSHALESAAPSEPVPPEYAELSSSLETQDGLSAGLDAIETLSDTASSSAALFPSSPFPELFLPLVAVTAVLGGLTIFYLAKYLKRS